MAASSLMRNKVILLLDGDVVSVRVGLSTFAPFGSYMINGSNIDKDLTLQFFGDVITPEPIRLVHVGVEEVGSDEAGDGVTIFHAFSRALMN